LSGQIRRLFRETVKALTRPEPEAPAPPKKSGRRKEGETRGRQFRRVARRITRWRLLSQSDDGATLWLADTLDWLDLWHPTTGSEIGGEEADNRPDNHLSPRL
jgi:hypothetical protein